MLVSFEVENWKSFKERTRISFVASREKGNAEKSAVLPAKYGTTKILPATAIYGANASGKTNFIQALALLKKLVVEGTNVNQMIPVQPFRLDTENVGRSTFFKVEALVKESIYVYEVACTKSDVVHEKLEIKLTRSAQVIFERTPGNYIFGTKFSNERTRLIAENTRPNQLFLHNAVAQNANEFRPMFDWFNKTLQVLGAEAQYEQYSNMLLRSDFLDFVNKKLKRYNTGAAQIELVQIERSAIPIPQEIIDSLIAPMINNPESTTQIRVAQENGPEIFIIQNLEGELTFSKIKTVHLNSMQKRVPFDLSDESKGTQKLIELLPLFFDLAEIGEDTSLHSKVYVVDELDRSFHSALTIDLIKSYLNACNQSTRNQLIFSTHDLILMEEKLLRRDELWFCIKGSDGSSTASCLGSHPGLRADCDLLKNYRKGLFGGYPSFKD